MTWIDDHSPEVETEQERIEREQYEAEMDRIDLMRRINELQHELEAERGWSERLERQRDEAEKRVAELEAAAATEPACNCEAARGAYGHWLSCEKCR